MGWPIFSTPRASSSSAFVSCAAHPELHRQPYSSTLSNKEAHTVPLLFRLHLYLAAIHPKMSSSCTTVVIAG